MGFTLKHRELDSRGSFVARGIGFEYEYDASSPVLSVIHARQKKPLLYIDCEKRLSKNPLAFVSDLEKATQINALVFSNRSNIDLSEILRERHLKIMLETSTMQASYSYDLKHDDFDLFEERFCKNYFLRKMRINKCISNERESELFRGELQTKTQNSIHSCGANLYSVMHALSNKTVNDLLANEFGHPLQKEAQNLMAISSNLSLIGKILDKNYHPMHKIKQIQAKNETEVV